MAKAQNTNYSYKKLITAKNISIIAAVILVVYLIGLFNPLTGPWFQYPYYKIGCGRDPVVTHSIMGKRYYTPDMKKYQESIRGASAIFCTEKEAVEAGFYRSSAQ
jgi:hypothetical protein